jgi:hypothetical protein
VCMLVGMGRGVQILGCSNHGGESVPPDPMRTGSSRVAYGKQGTPHTHMAVYIKDAPILGVHSDSRICKFADRYVSTLAEGTSIEKIEGQNKHSRN